MPRTILPQRNRRCALSVTGTRKPEEGKDTKGVTCFMEENVKWRDLMNIKETKFEVEYHSILLMSDWWTSISSFCKLIPLQLDFWNQLEAILAYV